MREKIPEIGPHIRVAALGLRKFRGLTQDRLPACQPRTDRQDACPTRFLAGKLCQLSALEISQDYDWDPEYAPPRAVSKAGT